MTEFLIRTLVEEPEISLLGRNRKQQITDDPIEDGSEEQQGHFRPPSHGAVRGRYRSYSSQPASS